MLSPPYCNHARRIARRLLPARETLPFPRDARSASSRWWMSRGIRTTSALRLSLMGKTVTSAAASPLVLAAKSALTTRLAAPRIRRSPASSSVSSRTSRLPMIAPSRTTSTLWTATAALDRACRCTPTARIPRCSLQSTKPRWNRDARGRHPLVAAYFIPWTHEVDGKTDKRAVGATFDVVP